MFPMILTVAPNAIGKSPRTETFGGVPSDRRMTLVGAVGGWMVPSRSPEARAISDVFSVV